MTCDEGRYTTPEYVEFLWFPLIIHGDGADGEHEEIYFNGFGDGDHGDGEGSGHTQVVCLPTFRQFKKIY